MTAKRTYDPSPRRFDSDPGSNDRSDALKKVRSPSEKDKRVGAANANSPKNSTEGKDAVCESTLFGMPYICEDADANGKWHAATYSRQESKNDKLGCVVCETTSKVEGLKQ